MHQKSYHHWNSFVFCQHTTIDDEDKSIRKYVKQWIILSLIKHAGFSKFLNNDL